MKWAGSILLLAIYISGIIRPVLPYIEYAINKQHISTQLCVNQDKPELKCNGQCYLMKRLQEMSSVPEATTPTDVPPVLSVEEVLAVHLLDPYVSCTISPEQQAVYGPDVNLHLADVKLAVPTPPPRFS